MPGSDGFLINDNPAITLKWCPQISNFLRYSFMLLQGNEITQGSLHSWSAQLIGVLGANRSSDIVQISLELDVFSWQFYWNKNITEVPNFLFLPTFSSCFCSCIKVLLWSFWSKIRDVEVCPGNLLTLSVACLFEVLLKYG